jgi:hypothetical protein
MFPISPLVWSTRYEITNFKNEDKYLERVYTCSDREYCWIIAKLTLNNINQSITNVLIYTINCLELNVNCWPIADIPFPRNCTLQLKSNVIVLYLRIRLGFRYEIFPKYFHNLDILFQLDMSNCILYILYIYSERIEIDIISLYHM